MITRKKFWLWLVLALIILTTIGMILFLWPSNLEIIDETKQFDAAGINDQGKMAIPQTDIGDAAGCSYDGDCQKNEICYNSVFCGEQTVDGDDCGPQFGDLKCHKLCQNDSDCPVSEPDCVQREIWIGDAGLAKKFCLARDLYCQQMRCEMLSVAQCLAENFCCQWSAEDNLCCGRDEYASASDTGESVCCPLDSVCD